MTPGRRLVYDFLNLPYHVQMAIGRELELVDVGETFTKNDKEMFVSWFAKAKREGKLDSLREKVSAAAARP